jgi:hypothetical protein
MTGLVAVVGLMALGSGLLKLFGKGRGLGGIPVWALLELLAGVGVPLYVLGGAPAQWVLTMVLFLTLALILVSSLLQVARVRALKRHREETESARLVTYVKYLSAQVTADGRLKKGKD